MNNTCTKINTISKNDLCGSIVKLRNGEWGYVLPCVDIRKLYIVGTAIFTILLLDDCDKVELNYLTNDPIKKDYQIVEIYKLNPCLRNDKNDMIDYLLRGCADSSKYLSMIYKEGIMESIDWSSIKKDTLVEVRRGGTDWCKRYFSRYDGTYVYYYPMGSTSVTSDSDDCRCSIDEVRLCEDVSHVE